MPKPVEAALPASDDWFGALTVSEQRHARGLCHHCAKPPEADGDHSCPCPFTDQDCPNHPDPKPAKARLGEPS